MSFNDTPATTLPDDINSYVRACKVEMKALEEDMERLANSPAIKKYIRQPGERNLYERHNRELIDKT